MRGFWGKNENLYKVLIKAILTLHEKPVILGKHGISVKSSEKLGKVSG